MNASRAGRWLLALAVATGLTGLLLKASEFLGPRGPTLSPERRGPPSPERHLTAPQRGDGSSSQPPGPGEPSTHQAVVRGSPEVTHGPTGPPSNRENSRAAAPAAERSHGGSLGHRREPRPGGMQPTGSKDAGSLEASTVGAESQAPEGIGRSGVPSGQVALPGQPVAAGQTAHAREPETPAGPPANADIAFESTGGDQYPLNSQVEIPGAGNLAGQAGTVSFWLQPEWGDGNQDDATLAELGDLQIVKNVHFLRVETASDGGVGGVGVPIDSWSSGEWHQVAATWNGNLLALYVDGELVTQTVRDRVVDVPPDAKLYVGSDYADSRPVAPGLLGRIDVRNHPLTPAEVATEYLRAPQ
jgi:hypothetical protein